MTPSTITAMRETCQKHEIPITEGCRAIARGEPCECDGAAVVAIGPEVLLARLEEHASKPIKNGGHNLSYEAHHIRTSWPRQISWYADNPESIYALCGRAEHPDELEARALAVIEALNKEKGRPMRP